MKKMVTVLMAALAVLFVSCQSSKSGDKDPAVAKGVNAWNRGNPESARAYWQEIEDSAKRAEYISKLQKQATIYSETKAKTNIVADTLSDYCCDLPF